MNTAHQYQTYDSLRDTLKLKTFQLKQTLSKKHDHISDQLLNRAFDVESIRQKSAHLLAAGGVIGVALLTTPDQIKPLAPASETVQRARLANSNPAPVVAPQKVLIDSMDEVLPEKTRPLTVAEEKRLEGIFSEVLHVNAKANLEGEHLNTTYGLIGAEQHLRRYPGDTMATHFDKSVDPSLHKEGMAPGLGAWGYFAKSKAEMTPDIVEKEKWYAVVQTLYLPDWNTRTKYLREWYKYRKVLIVNTDNGNAVVADIADSGPAMFTGKSFGGSPEVMTHLGGPRYKKGPVVLFFLDDPENKVPLGPVDYNKIDLPAWAFHQV